MDKNLISQFLNGEFNRMAFHIRYGGQFIHKPENLAEHTFLVSLIADNIVEDLLHKDPSLEIDRYKVLRYALYHDIEEAYSADIITPMKYKSTGFLEELEKVTAIMLEEGLDNDFKDNKHIASYIKKVNDDYEANKADILENRIVKFADIIQSLCYTIRELNTGNSTILAVADRLVEIIGEKYTDDKIFGIYAEQVKETVLRNNCDKSTKISSCPLNLRP